jgi:serine-aspartate repeat-containing protein C/D/E
VSVGNYVFEDVNLDGIQNGTDAPIAGVLLTLTNADGTPPVDATTGLAAIATTVTDANGKYLFSNLQPGTYKVTVTTPAGFYVTQAGQGTTATDSSTGSVASVTLLSGDADLTLDFGFVHFVSVGNYVFIDSNRNGIQDSGDVVLSNVTVTLSQNDVVVQSTVTDADGHYAFDGLTPLAEYAVATVGPASWARTIVHGTEPTSDSEGVSVTFTAPARGLNSKIVPDDPTFDFGFIKPVPAVSIITEVFGADGKWHDANDAATAAVVDWNRLDLSYRFTVTNTGVEETLTNVTLTTGIPSLPSVSLNDLAIGESVTSAVFTASRDQLSTAGSVNAVGKLSGSPVSASDPAQAISNVKPEEPPTTA